MTVLARCGEGLLIAEGERWTFARQPGSGGNVIAFVLGLVGTIGLANGVVFLASGSLGGLVGLVLGGGLITLAVLSFRHHDRVRTTGPIQAIVSLDLANGWLLGPTGQPIAPLTHVSFHGEMQMTSSSRKLVCTWPQGGRLVVLRGDAFGGGIGPAIDALRSRGLRV